MKRIALYIIFFMSGVDGLGYEILWTRMLSASLGHEIIAVLSVVSAFFAGLAIGAWFLDRPISRSSSPGKWFALLEMFIGLWALVLVLILPVLNDFIAGFIGVTPNLLRHWSISFLYPLWVLLPATVAMGATLPAMDRLFEQMKNDRHAVAGLYSVNTFGAVSGTAMVTFYLLPAFGMHMTSLLLALINFAGGACVLILSRKKNQHGQQANEPAPVNLQLHRFYPVLFITGMLGIGFKVTVVRVLSQILENTVFSFASMLIVFLFGSAVGAAVYHKVKSVFHMEYGLNLMLTSTAFFCLFSVFLLRYVEPFYQMFQNFFGKSFAGSVSTELFLSLLFFIMPTMSMGATFSHLALSLKKPDGGVGRALCLNTLGGAIAPLLFGVILLPLIGIKYTLLIIPVAYLLCMPRFRFSYATAGLVLIIAALWTGLGAPPYQFVSLEEGDTVVSYQEGVMASVSVVKDNLDQLHLKVNNHFQMGGTISVFSDQRQAFLPLLLHPKPENALFLGL